MFDLTGKVALITGGCGLLGPKHAEAILEFGGDVILADIVSEDKAKEVIDKLNSKNVSFVHMDVTDRSFFLLQQYGIKYSTREFYGIRLADGMYVKANEAYLKTSMPNMMLRTHLPIIIHQGDMMATYYERDMWKNGNKKEAEKVEQSVNKIKKAVDNEVKEKFNTKSTDAKDIFNELFGEKK